MRGMGWCGVLDDGPGRNINPRELLAHRIVGWGEAAPRCSQPATCGGKHATSWICGEAVVSLSEYPLRRADVRPSP